MAGQDVIHRRSYQASHFRVFLATLEQAEGRPDYGHFSSLVTFSPVSIAVSTAWDEAAAGAAEDAPAETDAAPDAAKVEISLTGYGEPDGSGGDMIPVADGQLSIGPKGVLVGDVVAGDCATVAIPPGNYVATVFVDALAPFVARKVRFHLMAL